MAAVRLAEDSMRRGLDHAHERLGRQRRAWWTRRLIWAAGELDRDPVELARECAPAIRAGGLLPLDINEWPPGLRAEDEPKLRSDRRFGRREHGSRSSA